MRKADKKSVKTLSRLVFRFEFRTFFIFKIVLQNSCKTFIIVKNILLFVLLFFFRNKNCFDFLKIVLNPYWDERVVSFAKEC